MRKGPGGFEIVGALVATGLSEEVFAGPLGIGRLPALMKIVSGIEFPSTAWAERVGLQFPFGVSPRPLPGRHSLTWREAAWFSFRRR